MRAEIPDKLYFKIGEVSKLAEVAPHVLRYWESEFKEIRPKRANSKQRLYRRQDVETVLLIKELLHEKGYTISGARKFLEKSKRVVPTANGTTVPSCLDTIKKELLQMKRLLEKKDR
ncbi:MAG: MerR family transcriptional regulator [Proteobacteria bacterium]|nr:MerR family transcriptional regulator [Pseudomonadota bacterium]MBU1058021.1 MerR family transcriptional regulator [Pseudomonadota bacterium]